MSADSMLPHRRATDALALALWEQLARRPAADRRVVYAALRTHAAPERSLRERRLLDAVQACAQELGHVPSRREWDTWRTGQTRPADWPSATALRNAFGGSWSRLRAAGGGDPSPDVLASRLAAMGGAYQREELLACLRQAAAASSPDPLTFEGYMRWARSETRRRGASGPRVACSGKPFRREFGSWAAAVGAAEVPATAARAWGQAYPLGAVFDALRRAAAETGLGGALTPKGYDDWVAAGGTAPSGARATPRSATVSRKFEGWANALARAGIIEPGEVHIRRSRAGVPMDDDELLAWLRRAATKLGPRISRSQYDAWRADEIVRSGAAGAAPPSDARLRLRFGGWEQARRVALAEESP